MKTIVTGKDIKEAIKLLKGEQVVINAKDNKIELIMNEITKDNEEVTLIKELNGTVENNGITIIDNNIMKLIKNNDDVTIENEQLSFGKRKVKFNNSECDFKELNSNGEKLLELTKEEYSHIISGMYATSKEEYRLILKKLKKVSFENENGKLRVVCLDGHRVAIRKLNKDFNYNLLIDTYILKVLDKIKFNKVEMLFKEEQKEIIFKTDNGYKLITRQFEGTKVLVEQVLPSLQQEKELKHKVKLDTKELLEIIESYTKDVKVTKMTFNNNKLVLESNESNYKLIDTCDIDYSLAEEFVVRYNPLYLKDMLKCFSKNKESETIDYSTDSNVSLGIFRLNENIVDYILPIRLGVAK